jgi:hypothetical protein
MVQTTIKSKLGNPVKVRYGAKVIGFPLKKGQSIKLNGDLKEIEM